mmetsp:Transcript_13354/g.48613  ORF Transcript_13354/g.48613 Transcript_13354/m.48613 type:complete len:553 (-) Transcript_13354:54-1712(-)
MASVLRHSWILPAIEEGLANLTEKRFFVRQSIQCSTCQCLQIGQGVGARHQRGRTMVVSDKHHYVPVLLEEKGWRQVETSFKQKFSQLRNGLFVLGSFYVDMLWTGRGQPRVYLVCSAVEYIGCGGSRHQFGQPKSVDSVQAVRDLVRKVVLAFDQDLVLTLASPGPPAGSLRPRAHSGSRVAVQPTAQDGHGERETQEQSGQERMCDARAEPPEVCTSEGSKKKRKRRNRKRRRKRRRQSSDEEGALLIPDDDAFWHRLAMEDTRQQQGRETAHGSVHATRRRRRKRAGRHGKDPAPAVDEREAHPNQDMIGELVQYIEAHQSFSPGTDNKQGSPGRTCTSSFQAQPGVGGAIPPLEASPTAMDDNVLQRTPGATPAQDCTKDPANEDDMLQELADMCSSLSSQEENDKQEPNASPRDCRLSQEGPVAGEPTGIQLGSPSRAARNPSEVPTHGLVTRPVSLQNTVANGGILWLDAEQALRSYAGTEKANASLKLSTAASAHDAIVEVPSSGDEEDDSRPGHYDVVPDSEGDEEQSPILLSLPDSQDPSACK